MPIDQIVQATKLSKEKIEKYNEEIFKKYGGVK